MVTYRAFDVVVVPFPFTDRATAKRRPALVLSDRAAFNKKTGRSVLAMITSLGGAAWPLDTAIGDLKSAGLPAASVVRMKLFTLDHELVLRKAGTLATRDRKAVGRALRTLFASALPGAGG